MPCKYVLHACVPHFNHTYYSSSSQDYEDTLINVMKCAEDDGGSIKTLALPVLGSNMGYNPAIFSKSLKTVIENFNFKYLKEIIVCEYDHYTYKDVL